MNHEFIALSPTICRLDHQEIVETSPVENVSLSSIAIEIPNVENLFSYELEANGAAESLFTAADLEIPTNLDWTDLEPITADAWIPLEDIYPTLTPSPLDAQSVGHPLSGLAPVPRVSHAKGGAVVQYASGASRPSAGRPWSSVVGSNARAGSKCRHDARYRESSSDVESDADGGNTRRGFLNNEDLTAQKPGTKLTLSLEERRMLEASGWRLPSRFPLTTAEERALRSVRRRIRNKLSAQASRKKRQAYVLKLENRISVSDMENRRLRDQLLELQNDKRDLISHIRRLRSYVARMFNRHSGRDPHDSRNSATPLPRFHTPAEEVGNLFLISDTAAGKLESTTNSNNNKHRRLTAAQAAAGGGTSLLVVTFFILAWTALVPLPSFYRSSVADRYAPGAAGANPLLSGHSRTLLQSTGSEGDTQPTSANSSIGGKQHDGTGDRSGLGTLLPGPFVTVQQEASVPLVGKMAETLGSHPEADSRPAVGSAQQQLLLPTVHPDVAARRHRAVAA